MIWSKSSEKRSEAAHVWKIFCLCRTGMSSLQKKERKTHPMLLRMRITTLGGWVLCLGRFLRSLVFSPCSIFQAMLDCHTKGSFSSRHSKRQEKQNLHSGLWENLSPPPTMTQPKQPQDTNPCKLTGWLQLMWKVTVRILSMHTYNNTVYMQWSVTQNRDNWPLVCSWEILG